MADGNMDTDKERVEEERKPTPEDNPRNRMFAEIAEREAEAKEDLTDVTGDEQPVEVQDEVVEEPTPAKIKIKANGVEEELTIDELKKRAELATGAEQKFQEAARLRKEAEELRQKQPVKEAAPTEEEDPRALARAIQMGSEEEAAQVITRLLRPKQTPDDMQRMVDQRLEFRNSAAWFEQNYSDIVKDENLRKLALDEDEKMVKSGDRRPYQERYKQIGDSLRKWKEGLATAPQVDQQKLERKANLKVVPQASVRAAPPQEDNDGPSDREFIAAEARRRGQGYPK